MGKKAGFRSGYVNASNLEAGDIQFTSGQASLSVNFDEAYREDRTPIVLLTNREDAGAAGKSDPYVTTRSETGFTAERATTGSTQDVSWMAIDQDN